MSKLIKMVSGGYKVEETEEIITANRLIPFGIVHQISNVASGGNEQTKNLNELIEKNDKLMMVKVKEHADEMKAPYFSLTIKHDYNLKTGIIRKINLKKSYVFTLADVQLYVFNKGEE